MNTLPQVTIPYDYEMETYLYYNFDPQSYETLMGHVKSFVGADCWAITVDKQIVFSNYNQNYRSYRQRILDSVVRQEIYDNPHSLFVHFHREKKPLRIRIYMFQKHTWCMNIDYDPKFKLYRISFSRSDEHLNYYQ